MKLYVCMCVYIRDVHHRHHYDRVAGEAVASLEHHDHVVRHATRIPLVRCWSPAEHDRSNERGVDQDVVSTRD